MKGVSLNIRSHRHLAGSMQLDWGARASRAAHGRWNWKWDKPLRDQPSPSVLESPPVSEQLRAGAEARAVREANRCPSSSNLPRPTREGACAPQRNHQFGYDFRPADFLFPGLPFP